MRRCPRGILAVVVITTRGRLDLDDGHDLRRCGSAPDGDGQLTPHDELLDEHLVAIGERCIERRRELLILRDDVDADARSLLRCLNDERQGERRPYLTRRIRRTLARIEAHAARCRNVLGRQYALCHDFIHGQCGGTHTRARIRNTEHVERALQDAVLAVFSMKGVEYNRGMECLNLLGEGRGVQLHADGGIALGAERLQDGSARAARDLCLGGGAAHDDDDRIRIRLRDTCRPRRSCVQLCDEGLADLEDVARAHRDNEVTRTHLLGEIALEIRTFRQVDDVLPRLTHDFLHHGLTADARDRCLPRRIDVCDQKQVGIRKAFAELRAQELCPRVAMRLKDADEPLGVRLPCRREGDGNLRRMMRIVVHDPDAALLALGLKTSLRTVELGECVTNRGELHAREARNSDAGECVEDVVAPRNIEQHAPHLRPTLMNGKRDHRAARLDVRCTVVRLMVDGVGNDLMRRLACDIAQDFVFKAEHRRPVCIHLLDELTERRDDLLHRAVVIHVVVLDVGHHSDMRAQLEEGAVALVGLRDEVAARAELRIRPEVGHLTADDDGRRYTDVVKGHADHGGRRRLAVRARDSDAVVLVDECRIDVRTMELWDAQIPRRNHLGVIVRDRRGDDDGICAAHVLRVLSVRPHMCTKTGKLADERRVARVRAGYRVAELEKDLSQGAHPRPADSDKMNLLNPLQFLEQRIHPSLFPIRSASAAISSAASGFPRRFIAAAIASLRASSASRRSSAADSTVPSRLRLRITSAAPAASMARAFFS